MSKMTNPAEIDQFVFAGNATFTISSLKTGARYTYRVTKAKKGRNPLWFVSLLSGPDNENDYTYIGVVQVRVEGRLFRLTAKSRLTEDALPVKAFRYFLGRLTVNDLPSCLEFRHEGRCGRCNRPLTVPESIDRGIGPECWSHMGGA